MTLPPCPASLKHIQPHLKVAAEHDERDPVVAYWCRLYALQTGLQLDKSSKEAKLILTSLMDWLEKKKKENVNNESITNEMAAQAYIENYALKLFDWADNMDRSSNFNKSVIKSFYTAGTLMDVLTTFSELSDDISQNRKYAKWKAAYINNCLKNGETPIPGPSPEKNEEEGELNDLLNMGIPKDTVPPPTPPPSATLPSNNISDTFGFVNPPSLSTLNIPDASTLYNPHPTPTATTPDIFPSTVATDATPGSVGLDPSLISKAQKYCKFASSALNYDDVPEAILNLSKALHLLQTGTEQ